MEPFEEFLCKVQSPHTKIAMEGEYAIVETPRVHAFAFTHHSLSMGSPGFDTLRLKKHTALSGSVCALIHSPLSFYRHLSKKNLRLSRLVSLLPCNHQAGALVALSSPVKRQSSA